MNDHEISAFSAYSSKKRPLSSEKLLKKKMKLKLKKKKRFQENNVNSVIYPSLEVMESSTAESVRLKKKKKLEGKGKKKTIFKEKEGSIFKDCTLTTKVDNVFFTENGFSNKSTSDDQSERGLLIKPKKPKKKKILNVGKQGLEGSPTFLKKKITSNFDVIENSSKDFKDQKIINNKKGGWLENKVKLPNIIYSDSVKLGEAVLSWLLSPMSIKEFFENCWEQKPLHIQHNNDNYFKSVCTLEDFRTAIKNHDMYFSRNIDITSYIDGERATENPEGKAKASVVWDFFRNGRSIRLLNPQTFIPNVQALNSTLQEFFHCFVGANIYLTPAGTQGFAPHYDDIEAFVLQLEGEKHWKLYNPRSDEEILPRESSKNFKEDEIGEPILEVTLKPGDLLYFPRGIIHQAKSLPHVHSLHITVSCYQKNSWADLLEKILPVALQSAINEDVEFRKGLPIGYLNTLGLVYSDNQSNQRQEIKNKFIELFNRILEYCPLDAGVDQLGANYAHDALPPCLTEVEKIYGGDRDCSMEENVLAALMKYKDKDLGLKLIRATSVRLISEQEEMFLYYTTDNSLVYHEHESCSLMISTQWAQALEYLIRAYPKFVQMKELPVSNNMNKPGKWKQIVEFVYFLWQKGLLLFDQPLRQLCS